MYRKLFINFIFLFCVFIVNQVNAQENNFYLSYSSSQGLSDLRYLNMNGLELEWQYQFKNTHFSVGLAVAYHFSNESDIIEIPDLLFGMNNQQMKNVKSIPIHLKARYELMPNKYFKPYVGLGAGLYYQSHGVIIQTYDATGETLTIDNSDWHFGFAPEIGVSTQLFSSLGTFISLKYNYIHNTFDRLDYNNISFNIGLVF